MNIGIYIYDNAEVLDFSGPFEVFSTASRISGDKEPFRVFLIGESGAVIHARAGFKVIPDYALHDHPPLDVLIIAGGVHHDEMNKKHVLQWLETQRARVPLIATVCTGIFILANAVNLGSCPVTTHWEDIPDLRKIFPELIVMENACWVDAQNLVSSGGISAGIDMSLYLVSRLCSRELAEKTARQMEYDWKKTGE